MTEPTPATTTPELTTPESTTEPVAESAPASPAGADTGSGGTASSYGGALAELEQLLTELEDTDIDVDRLAERVARGAELVRYCQERLGVVSVEVDKVVAELANATGSGPPNHADTQATE